MTREEAIVKLRNFADHCYPNEEFLMAIKALEQEQNARQFAEWVAAEIFDDMWEYNKNAFAEIACRKLAKLGIVRAKGDKWELVDPQERSDKE